MTKSTDKGFGSVLGLCCGIGLITVVGTLAFGRAGLTPDHRAKPDSHITAEFGRRVLADTTEVLGPDVADPKMRYTVSRLACGSCHIAAGEEPGNLSLATAITRYPRKSPRVGGPESIQLRINGCMMRSMNGRALPENSPEMVALVKYLTFLNEQDAAEGASRKKAHEPPAFKYPARKADFANGEKVFGERCAACHGKDGEGLAASNRPVDGFVFPPLWGPNSFNDGAGMHRVLTAAKFIKAKMPLGKADLNDEDAFDVSAWINSRPRPEMAGLEKDYPNRKEKPIDTGYGPYADDFPIGQHRFGPFQPIQEYYDKLPKAAK